MIKMEVIDAENNHFCVSGNEPFRVEVGPTHGTRNPRSARNFTVVAHVYRGTESNQDDDPVGAFDSTLPVEDLHSWIVGAETTPRCKKGSLLDAITLLQNGEKVRGRKLRKLVGDYIRALEEQFGERVLGGAVACAGIRDYVERGTYKRVSVVKEGTDG